MQHPLFLLNPTAAMAGVSEIVGAQQKASLLSFETSQLKHLRLVVTSLSSARYHLPSRTFTWVHLSATVQLRNCETR